MFKISVKLKNSKKFDGYGDSKKEAEQKAAKILLDSIKDKWSGQIMDIYYPKINLVKIL